MRNSSHEISGFALVEAILSVTIITLFVGVFVGISTHVHHQTSSMISRSHALLLAEEGLEATRAIRNADFSMLADGAHGLNLTGNEWEFSGVEDISGNFYRVILVEPDVAGVKRVTASVSWEERGDSPSVVLSTVLSDWR